MEGLRRFDEGQVNILDTLEDDSLAEDLLTLSSSAALTDQEDAAKSNKEYSNMSNLQETLDGIMKISGAKATALVDWESGLTLGTAGSNFDIDLAAAGNTNVVRSKLEIMKNLKIEGGIEDILITLKDQYHLIRMMHDNHNLFLYLALDRNGANLGMARHQLTALEKDLEI